jgi:hypothetical protein
MKTGGVIALVVLAGCAGMAVGSCFLGRGDSLVEPVPSDLGAENRRLQSQIAELTAARIREAEKTSAEEARAHLADENLAATRGEVEARRSEPGVAAAAQGSGGAPTSETKPRGPRFFADAHEGALKKVNWTTVGNNMGEMLTLIPGLATALARGEDPSAESIGRIQQLNGPLVTAALKLQDSVPGIGVNGKFSDPSFMVNAMAMTLEVAGLPLLPDQARALESTARLWMAKDRQRREGYDDRTWLIEKIYEEAELKDGFFREAFGQLTSSQATALSPDSVRGRVRLDLFSSSLIYAALARVEFFSSREELIEDTLRGASMAMRLTEEERTQAKGIVAEWADRLPQELLAHETDGLDVHGLIHTDLVTAAARQQHVLVKGLADALGFEGERLERVRNFAIIHAPLPHRTTPDAD